MKYFEKINTGYNSVFKVNQLTVGIVIPAENYAQSTVPTMIDHLDKVKKIEEFGFKSIWVRDVPLHVPSFGDAGQTFDPFTYLGFLAGQTSTIGLGIASIALPLHHPLHVYKSIATIDQLSGGRCILGVASGDRYEEYPGMNFNYDERGTAFVEAFEYIRTAKEDFPQFQSNIYGTLDGKVDVLPKPSGSKIPMIITGNSRQSIQWIAEHGDGWMYYPRNSWMQEQNIKEWRDFIPKDQKYAKPFMQPLYVDLHKDDDFKPEPIHLGFRIGAHYLVEYFHELKKIGVNHIAINLRFNSGRIEDTLRDLAAKVLPHFHTLQKDKDQT